MTETAWIVIGFAGQACFFLRFAVQWVASEREGRSVMPIAFWYLSIAGGLVILTYAIWRRDPVFIAGQSTGLFVYLRNLALIRRERRGEGEPCGDPAAGTRPGLVARLAGGDPGTRRWRLAVAVLLLGTAAIAGRELARAPIELHEAYVVETAREMVDRGEWVVPYFNAEPRLRKPPAGYWLTALAARFDGDGRPDAVHGRIPSAVAGVGLVAILLWMGAVLFDRPTALLGGAMMASTYGFHHYTHSARSDLLYAFWVAVALAAILRVWRSTRAGRGDPVGAAVVWLAFAAATLTKGPQLPAMVLAALLVWAWREGEEARRAVRALRPLPGSVAWIALAAPWWIVLHERLVDDGLAGTQLSGSLLGLGVPMPDYVWRVPQLIAPWFLLLPALAALEWRGEEGRSARWLAWMAGVPLFVLTVGSQQRIFYALPVLVPVVLLVAAGTRRVLAGPAHARLAGLARWTGTAIGVLVVVGLVGLDLVRDALPPGPADLPGRATVALAIAVVATAGLAWAARRRTPGAAPLFGAAGLFALVLWIVGSPLLEWSRADDAVGDLARVARRSGDEVATVGIAPDRFVYHAGPPVVEYASRADVIERLDPGREIAAIAPDSTLDPAADDLAVERLAEDPAWKDPRLAVAIVRRRPPPGPSAGPSAGATAGRDGRTISGL